MSLFAFVCFYAKNHKEELALMLRDAEELALDGMGKTAQKKITEKSMTLINRHRFIDAPWRSRELC